MHDERRILPYKTPDPPHSSHALPGVSPRLAFAGAVLSAIVTQSIWMAGVFGSAHRDDIAMISVLGLGAVSAFAGCVSGFYRHDKAHGSGVRRAAGCLMCALNLGTGCLLIYAIVGISRRMY